VKVFYIVLYLLPLFAFSQTRDCHAEWVKKFTERGAETIEDGLYSDVIITFRKAGHSSCQTGTASVKDGKVTSFFLEEENGQLIKITREWQSDLMNVKVANGMSSTMIASGGEQIVIFWPKKIKPNLTEHKREEKTCGGED
jgi:hypothetical protein